MDDFLSKPRNNATNNNNINNGSDKNEKKPHFISGMEFVHESLYFSPKIRFFQNLLIFNQIALEFNISQVISHLKFEK